MDKTSEPVGGWTLILSMREGNNNAKIRAPQEFLLIARTWDSILARRGEPRMKRLGGDISSTGHDLYVFFGESEHDSETTLKMLSELGSCFGNIFGLEVADVYMGGKKYPLTRTKQDTGKQSN